MPKVGGWTVQGGTSVTIPIDVHNGPCMIVSQHVKHIWEIISVKFDWHMQCCTTTTWCFALQAFWKVSCTTHISKSKKAWPKLLLTHAPRNACHMDLHDKDYWTSILILC